jgi:hypothetical protein
MGRLLKEPLLHFLLVGAALFAAFSYVADRDQPGDQEIVVSAGKIEHLEALFAQTWQRSPTRPELELLVRDFVHEEAAYRQGMALGLDRNDTIIRRRIRQKLEFVAQDLSGRATPTDHELTAYLAANPDKFRKDARLTFRQVYLDPEQRRDSVEADALELLIELNGNGAPTMEASTLGDSILLEHGYSDVAQRDVGGLFGQRFAMAVAGIEPGEWRGPIESAYGVHLVLLQALERSRLPELGEIRAEVEREWANDHRLEMVDDFHAVLLDRYEVVIEWPEGRATKQESRGGDS